MIQAWVRLYSRARSLSLSLSGSAFAPRTRNTQNSTRLLAHAFRLIKFRILW